MERVQSEVISYICPLFKNRISSNLQIQHWSISKFTGNKQHQHQTASHCLTIIHNYFTLHCEHIDCFTGSIYLFYKKNYLKFISFHVILLILSKRNWMETENHHFLLFFIVFAHLAFIWIYLMVCVVESTPPNVIQTSQSRVKKISSR